MVHILRFERCFLLSALGTPSQEYFTFEGKDSEGGFANQLIWTSLPQGFKNSPTVFDKALHQDLRPYLEANQQVTLLQYGDDILLAAKSKEQCLEGIKNQLSELGKVEYWASVKKA